MADSYKGLIIRIGGDTSGLTQALKASNKAINTTQKQLKQLERASKLDTTGTTALKERLDLMGDRAQALTTKLTTMNRTLAKMDGSKIKLLSEMTSDAAYNAQALTSKYAAVIDKIKALKNQIAKTTLGDAFNVNDVETDPFTKLNSEGKNLLGTVAQVKAKIRELNGVSTDGKNDTAQVKQQIAAYEQLVAEFKKVSAAKKLASEAAEFKDMQVEIASARAQARALYQQMQKLASENPAATQTVAFRNLAEKLSALGSEATQLKSRLSGLDEAMKLDPTNIDVAKARLQTLSQSVQVNQTRMAALRSELKQLDTADGSISALANSSRNLASELYAANSRCTSLRERIAELKSETGATNQAEKVAALESKLSEATSQANRLATAMRYSSVNAELQTVSASTNALSNSMSGALTKSSQFRGVLQNVGWTLTSTISPAVLMFGHYAVNAADEVDSAYRDMRKTVQGTEQQFESLKQAALDYSRTHVTSADTILEIEAMGGQLGVATSKLESFATVVSNLDIATDLDADTAAEQLGQLSGILNDMTDNDFAKYGDALTRLGNNNSTLESKISDVMLRISSMGTITGFTTPQLLAWSTAVAATGQGSEAAGTAISKTMSDIESAVGAGGDKLQNFATVAGMSATEFASKWKSDPSEAMQSFIQGLKQVEAEGGSADNTLTSLGITSVRQKQAILGLTQTIDTLSDNLTMSQDAWDGVSDQWGDAGDAAREAERKAEGFSGAISILQNNAQALGTEMGSELTPLIQSLAGVVATVTAAYSGASSATKLFVNGLLALVAGGGTALVFLAGLLNALNAIKTTVSASLTMKAAAEGMQLASTAASGLRTALALVAEAYLTSASASEKAAAKEILASEASGVAATATKVLSAALKALPWVAVATLAVDLITQLSEYASACSQSKQATEGMESALETVKSGASEVGDVCSKTAEEVISSADSARKSQAELASSITDSFNTVNANEGMLNSYVSTIKELAGNCDGSAESQSKLRAAVQGYNEITGESITVTDSVTGTLSKSTSELESNAEAWKLNAKAQALQEAYSDALKQQTTNKAALMEVDAKLASQEKGLGVYIGDFAVAADSNAVATHDLESSRKQLEEQDQSNANMLEYLASEIQNCKNEQAAANGKTQEATDAANLYAAALGKTSDEFSELVTETTKVVDGSTGMQQLFQQTGLSADEFAYSLSMLGIDASDLASQMESMSDTVQNAFSEMSTGEDISVQTMIENLQKNASAANEWSANITDLYQRAGDAGKSFVDYIAAQGPQYATAVANLKDATDDELQEVIAAYNDAGYASMNAAATGANANADTIKATATELGKQVSTSFQEGVSSTDGTGAGQQQAQEVVMGMESGADAFSAGVGTGSDYSEGVSSTEGDAASSGDTIATASEEQVTLAQQTFWQIGASIGSNYAEGIYSKIGEAASAGTAIAMSAADSCGKGSATAYQWGAHLGSNFAEGIYSKTGEASAAGAALAAAAGESTHFSVPKKGIWSGAEKGGWRSGTHLVQNFAQGIRDQIPELSSAAQEAAQAAAVALNGGKYQANLASATNYAQASVSPAKVTVSVKDANEAVTGWLDKNLPSIISDNAPNLVIDNDAGRMVVDTRLNQLQRKAAMNRG
jgi:TP901 family phage tail tape measure protein